MTRAVMSDHGHVDADSAGPRLQESGGSGGPPDSGPSRAQPRRAWQPEIGLGRSPESSAEPESNLTQRNLARGRRPGPVANGLVA